MADRDLTSDGVATLSRQLLGAWKLVSVVETNLDTGEKLFPYGEQPEGICLYTEEGYVSAQIGQASYMGYVGSFTVDEDRRRVVHRVLISNEAQWTNTDQVRVATLEGDRLELDLALPRFCGGSLWSSSLVWVRAGHVEPEKTLHRAILP